MNVCPDIGGSGLEKLCVKQVILMLTFTGIQEKQFLCETMVMNDGPCLLVSQGDRGVIRRPVHIDLVGARKGLCRCDNGGINAGLSQPQNAHHQRDEALCVCGAEGPSHGSCSGVNSRRTEAASRILRGTNRILLRTQ